MDKGSKKSISKKAKAARSKKPGGTYGKRFGKMFLNNMGMDTGQFAAEHKTSSIGRMLIRMGVEAAPDDNIVDLPELNQPSRVTNTANPSLSTLNKQLASLAATASRLGIITKEQQDNLVKQIKQSNRNAKEQEMEAPYSPHADMVQNGADSGSAIGPMEDTFSDLIKAIETLNEKIEEKVQEESGNTYGSRFMDLLADNLGLGDVRKEAKVKAMEPKLRKGYGFDAKSGRYFQEGVGADGKTVRSFVREEDALKNAKTATLQTPAARARRAEAVAEKMAKPGIISRSAGKAKGAATAAGKAVASTKIGSLIGRGVKGAGAATKGAAAVGKEGILKVARPLVKSALGKTAIKSIPIIGAAAGGLFAIGKLLQGDVVGAGLDAASGLGGPLTAIPAMVASIARDTYSSAFGVQPEMDPMFGPRMALVTSIVSGLVKSWLGQKTEKAGEQKAAPTGGGAPAVPAKAPEAPGMNAQPPAKQESQAPAIPSSAPSPTPQATPVSQTPPGGGGAGSASDTGAAETAAAKSPMEQAPVSSLPTPTAAPVDNLTKTGAQIAAASGDASAPVAAMGETGSTVPKPSTLPTNKPNAKGMGNVPEPSYFGAGSIVEQLFFGSVAGAMA